MPLSNRLKEWIRIRFPSPTGEELVNFLGGSYDPEAIGTSVQFADTITGYVKTADVIGGGNSEPMIVTSGLVDEPGQPGHVTIKAPDVASNPNYVELRGSDAQTGVGGGAYVTGGGSGDDVGGPVQLETQNGGPIIFKDGSQGEIRQVWVSADTTGKGQWGGLPFALHTSASDPSLPTAGLIYFNTSTGKIKIYTGSAWQTVTST